jgi:zinc/manganese transport system permease protein
VLGISVNEIAPVAVLGAVCIVAIMVLYRPLMLSSVMPELGEARGVRAYRIEMCFLVVLALATSMALPVVGALLIFSLMIGPPAAARAVTDRPLFAMGLSVVIALATVWIAIAVSYHTNWPVGFFVGTIAAICYAAGRACTALRRTRVTQRAHLSAGAGIDVSHAA